VADRAPAERPTLTLDEVARLVGGRVEGDPALRVSGVAPLSEAGEDQLALLAHRKYLADLKDTRGGAVLVAAALQDELRGRPGVVVDEPHGALATLLPHLYPSLAPAPGIHPTAVVGSGARVGVSVCIGPYAVVEEECDLGDRVQVGSHVVIGRGSRVGEETLLHPHVVLYPGTVLGRRVIVHAGARIGSDGFGYVPSGDGYQKVPQVGACVVEDDVEIGANSCIDRGSIGATVIGRGSKLDNLVHIGHNVHVGSDCAMAALVGIAGSARIGRGVVFGGQSGAAGHMTIGDGARVAARAGAINDVAPGETVAGFPAREIRAFMKGTALVLRLPELMRRLRALERRAEPPTDGRERSADALD
jgi:UDP-3-O-[3-hydroxymyristoyl] glucosamine N-acyltransferase